MLILNFLLMMSMNFKQSINMPDDDDSGINDDTKY